MAVEEEMYRGHKFDPPDPVLEGPKLNLTDSNSESEISNDSIRSADEEYQDPSYNFGKPSEIGLSTSASRTTLSGFRFQFLTSDTKSTAVTETSKGATQADHDDKVNGVRYQVPKPPHPNDRFTGEPFLCPFCGHMILDVKSPSEWKYVTLMACLDFHLQNNLLIKR